MRLFLSYSREDRATIDELASILQKGGQEVWIDDAIRIGEHWRDSLRQAIEDSDGIVLSLTPNWLASPWCQWEFVTAVELQKKVIPVLISQTNVPGRISQYQYANFVDGFSDTEQVQKFLDDLLVLATDIDISAVGDISKSELERKIDQEIKLGNIRDSSVEAVQKSDGNDGTGTQGVAAGDITGSTVTIRQETTKIGSQTIHQGEKQRNWTIPVILGLLLALIGTTATVMALLPETQRERLLFSVGLIPASATPVPTNTPEAPSPVGFKVIVAGFGYENPNGAIERNRLTDNLSDIIASELNQVTEIDATLSWRSDGVGHILGQTPVEREAQAAQIAYNHNADVVVYGIVRSDGVSNIFEPEFYIMDENAALESEVIGADTLGNPLEFGNSEDEILAANNFQRRLGVMRYFLRGLASYLAGNFEDARDSFEEALAVESEGLEILYVFAGNAAVRIPELDQALEYYNSALQQRPGYARALVGRGIVIYQKALEVAGENPPPYDSNLKLDPKQTCSDVDVPIPQVPQLLGELALRCYTEARLSTDQPVTADIDVKAAFGAGQASLWLSTHGYGDYWQDVLNQLSRVIALYDASPEERQLRIRAMTGHAYAWLGLRLLSLEPKDSSAVCDALNHYRTAVELLELAVNRSYNRQWIDTYSRQITALEEWLSSQSIECSIANTAGG